MEERTVRVQEVDIPAIEIKDLVKIYKLYDRPRDRVKEALGSAAEKFTSFTMR